MPGSNRSVEPAAIRIRSASIVSAGGAFPSLRLSAIVWGPVIVALA